MEHPKGGPICEQCWEEELYDYRDEGVEPPKLSPWVSPETKELAQLRAKLAALREQEPVGWTTEDFDTDKSATTYDRAVAERWAAKGWPVEPLYRYPPAIPDGFVRVPVEITESMLAELRCKDGLSDMTLKARYKAMLAAQQEAQDGN
jgi:hypothetical protein